MGRVSGGIIDEGGVVVLLVSRTMGFVRGVANVMMARIWRRRKKWMRGLWEFFCDIDGAVMEDDDDEEEERERASCMLR